jgi:toxin ParE1/3/4
MKLYLTEQAADQIAKIIAYLVMQRPLGVRYVLLAMQGTFAQRAEFPGLGRRQRTAGPRKLGVGRYPYNVYYSIDDQAGEIVIISVRHTSRAPHFLMSEELPTLRRTVYSFPLQH